MKRENNGGVEKGRYEVDGCEVRKIEDLIGLSCENCVKKSRVVAESNDNDAINGYICDVKRWGKFRQGSSGRTLNDKRIVSDSDENAADKAKDRSSCYGNRELGIETYFDCKACVDNWQDYLRELQDMVNYARSKGKRPSPWVAEKYREVREKAKRGDVKDLKQVYYAETHPRNIKPKGEKSESKPRKKFKRAYDPWRDCMPRSSEREK